MSSDSAGAVQSSSPPPAGGDGGGGTFLSPRATTTKNTSATATTTSAMARRKSSLISHVEVSMAPKGMLSGPATRPPRDDVLAHTGQPDATNAAAADASAIMESRIPTFMNHMPHCFGCVNDASIASSSSSVTTASSASSKRPPGGSARGGAVPYQHHFVATAPAATKCLKCNKLQDGGVHPAVARVGVLMRHRIISGGNARAVAMLNAFIRFFEDYTPMPYREIEKHLEAEVNSQFNFLTQCRPHNIGMGNALRFVKKTLHDTRHLGSDELIQTLTSGSNHFIQERIIAAAWQIAVHAAANFVEDGDHIVLYPRSSACRIALLTAAKLYRKRFRVTVVDTRPAFEAKKVALEFSEASGIEIAYTVLHSLSAFIPDCTKVFLGAAAVMGNGNAISKVGSASVAALAHSMDKPVYVLVESYKFTERNIQSPFSHNILDDPLTLLPASHQIQHPLKLNPLNIVYDVVQQECLTGVVSEHGFMAASHIPREVRRLRNFG